MSILIYITLVCLFWFWSVSTNDNTKLCTQKVTLISKVCGLRCYLKWVKKKSSILNRINFYLDKLVYFAVILDSHKIKKKK